LNVRTSHTSEIARPLQGLHIATGGHRAESLELALENPKSKGRAIPRRATALPHRSDLLATAGCDCRAIFSTDNDLNAPIQLPAAGLRIVRDRVRLAVPLRCDARRADSTI
jgi:hypothetical protein